MFRSFLVYCLMMQASIALAGEGGTSSGGSYSRPTAIAFVLTGGAEGDAMAEAIEHQLIWAGAEKSAAALQKADITYPDGAKARMLCAEFTSFDRLARFTKAVSLSDLPVSPNFPNYWRGKCKNGLPVLPEVVHQMEMGSCSAKRVQKELHYRCAGDLFCKHRVESGVDKALPAQGWKKIPGTNNWFSECK